MESARSALRLGCPVRFRDRWQGRLAALEIDDQWLVLNLVLSRGIFRRTEVKLPSSAARLAGALVESASRRASHLLLTWGLLAPGLHMVPVQNGTLSGGVI
jgi:hypothetical protein